MLLARRGSTRGPVGDLAGGAVTSSPAVTSGAVYIGSGDGNVYARNPVTGLIMRDTQTRGSLSSSPGVANGVVYAGSPMTTNGPVEALTWERDYEHQASSDTGSKTCRECTSGGLARALNQGGIDD